MPLVATLGLALLVAGCGGSGGDGGGGGGPGDTGGAAGATRVEVTMTDYYSIRPTPMTVAAGVPVTFVVANLGETTHQFYVGDAAAQAAREQEMAAADGVGEDSPEGIVVPPGETKELVITLEPGTLIAGCHIPQHYARNMRATINVIQ
jgi:uncharacterized cupredoxin-like copper-binding protein